MYYDVKNLFCFSNFRPVNTNYVSLSLSHTFQEPPTSNARVPPLTQFSGAFSSPISISLWLCAFIHRLYEPFDDCIPSPIVLSLCASKDRKHQRCYPRLVLLVDSIPCSWNRLVSFSMRLTLLFACIFSLFGF